MSEELKPWEPMNLAPRDGTRILAMIAPNESRYLEHNVGRIFEIRHEGVTAGGYNMGWAVYPGFGGAPDHYFIGWMPSPLPPLSGTIAQEITND